MAITNEIKIVEVKFNMQGSGFEWVKAYVTWENERSMRVTPIDGDPLHSIHIDKKLGEGDLYRLT